MRFKFLNKKNIEDLLFKIIDQTRYIKTQTITVISFKEEKIRGNASPFIGTIKITRDKNRETRQNFVLSNAEETER